MNSDTFETQWPKLRGLVLRKWDRLTEEDVRQINGRSDLLITKLEQKYGYTREQAEEEFRDWKPASVKEDEVYASSSPSWLPWLLLAIPLLFVIGYLGNRSAPATNDTYTAPRTTTEDRTIPRTTEDDYAVRPSMGATDTMTAQKVRDAILENRSRLANLSDLRVTSTDGVVTISGTVPTKETKDLITRIVERVNDVKKVNNEVEVKP